MSDIKFQCETCGQPILVDAAAAGRTIRCPSCQSALVIRAPKEKISKPERPRVKPVLAKPVGQRRKPGGASLSGGAEAPGKRPSGAAAAPASPATQPPPVELASRPPGPQREPAAARPLPAPPLRAAIPATLAESAPAESEADVALGVPPGVVQVAALTPELKLAIVQSARAELADAARWMPGVSPPGKLAYAARREGDTLVLVEASDATATHFSLMGAILLEFHRRNVIATASGRADFLDREIPAMIREVAPEAAAETPAEAEGPGGKVVGLMGIAHAQCLAVLEGLARRYEAEARGETSDALRQARGFTVEELVGRAARDELVSGAEIVRAVHRELTELRDRVAALEKSGSRR